MDVLGSRAGGPDVAGEAVHGRAGPYMEEHDGSAYTAYRELVERMELMSAPETGVELIWGGHGARCPF